MQVYSHLCDVTHLLQATWFFTSTHVRIRCNVVASGAMSQQDE